MACLPHGRYLLWPTEFASLHRMPGFQISTILALLLDMYDQSPLHPHVCVVVTQKILGGGSNVLGHKRSSRLRETDDICPPSGCQDHSALQTTGSGFSRGGLGYTLFGWRPNWSRRIPSVKLLQSGSSRSWVESHWLTRPLSSHQRGHCLVTASFVRLVCRYSLVHIFSVYQLLAGIVPQKIALRIAISMLRDVGHGQDDRGGRLQPTQNRPPPP